MVGAGRRASGCRRHVETGECFAEEHSGGDKTTLPLRLPRAALRRPAVMLGYSLDHTRQRAILYYTILLCFCARGSARRTNEEVLRFARRSPLCPPCVSRHPREYLRGGSPYAGSPWNFNNVKFCTAPPSFRHCAQPQNHSVRVMPGLLLHSRGSLRRWPLGVAKRAQKEHPAPPTYTEHSQPAKQPPPHHATRTCCGV